MRIPTDELKRAKREFFERITKGKALCTQQKCLSALVVNSPRPAPTVSEIFSRESEEEIRMQGKFFGYKEEPPCPTCGTARVGEDWDDDYYVIPGVLREIPATCTASDIYHWQQFSPKAEDYICGFCGGAVLWGTKTESGGFRGPVTKMVGVCQNSFKKINLDRFEGCPKCNKRYHHIPLHSE